MKNYLKYFVLAVLFLTACEKDDSPNSNPDPGNGNVTSGDADFSTYVAVGNSLTAGFANNALYRDGQENAYPNIMAEQFALAGGGDFKQPLMADNLGGLLLNGVEVQGTRLILSSDEIYGYQYPVNKSGTPQTEVTNKLQGPFNNMGVPGAKVYDLIDPGFGAVSNLPDANPYFVRFSSSASASVIDDAVAQNPTFFSLWIGNNDVLGYALAGGTGVDQTGNADTSTYGPDDITDPQVFQNAYANALEALEQDASEGVVVNIPNVASAPYFTRVPYDVLDPEITEYGDQIATLNSMFAPLNDALSALGHADREVYFDPDVPSPVVIEDKTLDDISDELTQQLVADGFEPTQAAVFGQQFGRTRQATQNDKILLISLTAVAQVDQAHVQDLMDQGIPFEMALQLSFTGISYGLGDAFVLLPEELDHIEQATQAYNATIENLAQTYSLAHVDANSILNELNTGGFNYDGGVLTSEYINGDVFSLDGVHLTPRGYAFMANRILGAINATYNSTLPEVDLINYEGRSSFEN